MSRAQILVTPRNTGVSDNSRCMSWKWPLQAMFAFQPRFFGGLKILNPQIPQSRILVYNKCPLRNCPFVCGWVKWEGIPILRQTMVGQHLCLLVPNSCWLNPNFCWLNIPFRSLTQHFCGVVLMAWDQAPSPQMDLVECIDCCRTDAFVPRCRQYLGWLIYTMTRTSINPSP